MQTGPTQSTTLSIAVPTPAASNHQSPLVSSMAMIVVLLPGIAVLGILARRQCRSIVRRRRIAKLERLWNLKPIERKP